MKILLLSILVLFVFGCKVDENGNITQDDKIILVPPKNQGTHSQVERVYFSVQAADAKAVTGVKSGSPLSLGITKNQSNQNDEFKAFITVNTTDGTDVQKLELVTDRGVSRSEGHCDSLGCKLDISALLEEQNCGDETFVALAADDDVFLFVHKKDETQQKLTFQFESVCNVSVAKTTILQRNVASVEGFNPILSIAFVCILLFLCCFFLVVNRAKTPKP